MQRVALCERNRTCRDATGNMYMPTAFPASSQHKPEDQKLNIRVRTMRNEAQEMQLECSRVKRIGGSVYHVYRDVEVLARELLKYVDILMQWKVLI